MGQGRKKGQRDYSRHHRKRSIVLDVENQDSLEVMQYLGTAAIIRNRLEIKSLSSSRHRNPTPFPSSSSVSCSYPSETTEFISSKCRDASSASPTNVCLDVEIPFVPTLSICEKEEKSFVEIFYTFLFQEPIIYQNQQQREITLENRHAMLQILSDLFEHIHFDNSSISQSKEIDTDFILNHLLQSHGPSIIRYLVDGCRYEHMYGLSLHIAFLDKFCSKYPDLVPILYNSLYESVVDFYEMEREDSMINEDSFYMKETPYGQIHRIIELWSSTVNNQYCDYFLFLQHQKDHLTISLSSSSILLRTGLLLLQLTSVTQKYRLLLVSSFMKLMYIYPENIHLFLHSITSKFPITSPKKMVAWIEMLTDLFEQFPLFLQPDYNKEVRNLISKITKSTSGNHIDYFIQYLHLINNKHFLINYILNYPDRIEMVENCLCLARNHWNEVVREKGEEIFDLFLDYLEA